MIRFLHAADFHLDSPFSSLPPRQAAERRRELRQLPDRLAAWTAQHPADVVLLSGDLLDGQEIYPETVQALRSALGRMSVPVFIAPGNHDWMDPSGVWNTVEWPENVHVFASPEIEAVELPEQNAVVYGAAFTGPEQTEGLLRDFRAPQDGRTHLMVLHGELDGGDRYNPVDSGAVAASGLDYLALGHIHRRGSRQLGQTLCAWPGCPEGRGFDETGEKGFYIGAAEPGRAQVQFVPFASRRCEILTVDITGRPPLPAVLSALPEGTEQDLYRVLLTGETAERIDLRLLQDELMTRFYGLELQDQTRLAEDIWARAGEDSLRGLFLAELRRRWESAGDDAERETVELAARLGLAALDHRDLG